MPQIVRFSLSACYQAMADLPTPAIRLLAASEAFRGFEGVTLIRVDGDVIQSKRQQNLVGFTVVEFVRRIELFGIRISF
jgi:hypothetical protein